MTTSALQIQENIQQILQQQQASFEYGLSSDDVISRREESGHFNTVKPPVQCPAWICCLLPCIRHIPSMKAYQQIQPEDAEVKRGGRWIRYDASALVCGDIIRIEEGDIVPADCIVITLDKNSNELLIDHRYVSGDDKPISIKSIVDHSSASPSEYNVDKITTVFWGGRVVLGSGIAVCIAVGPNTRVATLIQNKKFPPPTGMASSIISNSYDNTTIDTPSQLQLPPTELNREDDTVGVALLRQNSREGSTQMV
jgi:magnesium-transporting ATPase (P-type)